MKKNYKLTFLMAAHNEEKLISYALARLVNVHKDYPFMEVLIGLDGCTDKTPEIVNKFSRKYKFFKIFELNERKGKQVVLNKLEPHIVGDLVIIHDADWTFEYGSKKDLLDYLSVFNNLKIGGIVDSIESKMSRPDFWKINSLGFIASAWGNKFLLEYNKKKFTKKIRKGLRIYDKNKMKFCPFMDTYRKKALDRTKSSDKLRAGDHVERTLRVLNAGYDIVTFDNENWPHFPESYNKQSVTGLINQKVRGIVSKKKIESVYNFKIPFFGFYVPFLLYIVSNSFKVKRLKDFAAIYVYLFAIFYAVIAAKLKEKASVEDVWNLRVR